MAHAGRKRIEGRGAGRRRGRPTTARLGMFSQSVGSEEKGLTMHSLLIILTSLLLLNGSVFSAKTFRIDHEPMMPITKDVRPRPMMDWIEKKNEKKMQVEGSASNPLWDDEDSDDVSGSGSGMPPIIDTTPVKAIIQEDHPKNIDLSTNPKGPSVIVTEQGTQPDGSSIISIYTSLVLVAIVRFL